MNEEQLLQAMRNAHAAGDASAAKRFARMIAELRSGGGPAPVSRSMAAALAAGHQELSPAEEARADVAGMSPLERRAVAQVQGLGSGLFGAGTPLTAAGRMVGTLLPGGDAPASPGEALEYARARREAVEDSNPGAFYSGVAASLVGGAGVARGVARAFPRVASVFTPKAGRGAANLAKNTARLAGVGAAASGVTALNEAGVEAVPSAATGGAILGPVAAVAARGVAGGAAAVRDRLSGTENAAFRVLARRIGTAPRVLQQRFQEFRQTWGRNPSLAEIVNQEGAEELGQVARVRTSAGRIFRDTEEAARLARQQEAPRVIRNRGRLDSETAVQGRLQETAEAAADVARRGLRTTPLAVRGARDVEMDDLMTAVGDHNVPVTPDMLDLLQSPDVFGTLPGAVRRRLVAAAEAGEAAGATSLTVREWDMIRQAVSRGSRAGAAAPIYRELRNRIRDYVGGAVPEYGEGLRRFGQRSDFAKGVELGGRALKQDVSEFADRLRTAGGGTLRRPTRPEVRQAVVAGAGAGARTRLANALSGSPEKVEGAMRRLASDPALRRNLSRVLDPDEMRELTALGERYGVLLDFSAGIRTGRGITRLSQQGDDDFREAVATASAPVREGIRRGARGALSEAAGQGPDEARQTLVDLAESNGLYERLVAAMGVDEAGRLRRVGQTGTRAARNLEDALPPGTHASARAAEKAQETQKWIGAGVVAAGRASGAMIANVGNWIVQHTTLSSAAARELAEMAVDPTRAHRLIARLRKAGVDPDNILRMYRESATAAGITIGRD